MRGGLQSGKTDYYIIGNPTELQNQAKFWDSVILSAHERWNDECQTNKKKLFSSPSQFWVES